MIVWILIIVASLVFYYLAYYFLFPAEYIYFVTVVIFVSILGLVYRAYIRSYRQRQTELCEELEREDDDRRREHDAVRLK